MRERRSWLNVLGGVLFALSLGAVSAAQALTQDLTSQFAITRSVLYPAGRANPPQRGGDQPNRTNYAVPLAQLALLNN